ncbi:hypothetical protein CEP52_017512 [Fusarium oligoseptatum]|uniref:Uncharacterized protein n=1 Tax=Fusarium oligoseptatum TaxID=2604345 RepID=A0A428RPU2_9HYPO|nr:hypothetical protein CEP52_017512 [Fusarium oligoseptatum]
MRHPSDASGFDEYCRYLPGQWCPMVTVTRSVPSTGDRTGDLFELRRFTIETAVYDSSASAPAAFSVACLLESTKRWHRVKTATVGALLSITAKIAGRTTDTNQPALRVLDLATSRGRYPSPRPRRRRPLLRIQSGPSAGRVEPLGPPLLKGDEAPSAPAPQGLPTIVSSHKPQRTVLICRLPEKVQIRLPIPRLH